MHTGGASGTHLDWDSQPTAAVDGGVLSEQCNLASEVTVPNLEVSDLRPFIPAKDFVLSKQFYAGLGWKVKDVDAGLALVQLADQHFYIQNYYLKEFAENCMLHLTVEDAQAWYQHVSSVLRSKAFSEARVHPPKQQPYGAIVTFLHDPAGVLLHLCQWQR